jgi:glycosyltransferase involved in cell wall biosynthesis
MKSILLVVPRLSGKGGVAQYWNNLIPILRTNDGVDLEVFEMGGQTTTSRLHYLDDQWRLRRLLQTKHFDLVHLNPSLDFKSFVRDGLFIWSVVRSNIPFMVSFHGWDLRFETKVDQFYKWFFNLTYRKATLIEVLARGMADKLIEWGVSQGRVQVYTTCVNGSFFLTDLEAAVKAEAISRGDINILFLSRLVENKGLVELLSAFTKVREVFEDTNLLVAGDGPLVYVLENYKDEARIKPLGYVSGDQKKKLLQESHIICLPSATEGLPVSILEGMASGCAVVCTPVGGLRDLIEDPKMGKLCAGDEASIAKALIGCMENRAKLAETIKYNHGYAKKHFTAELVSDRIINSYLKDF